MKLQDKVCCFMAGGTNGQESPAFPALLKEELRRLITEQSIRRFICGMTPGELTAAAVVLELRQEYPAVVLDCVLPYEEQAARWSNARRERYFNILAECDSVITLQNHYDKKCLCRHRKHILDNAQYAVCMDSGHPKQIMAAENRLNRCGIPYSRIPVCQQRTEAVS